MQDTNVTPMTALRTSGTTVTHLATHLTDPTAPPAYLRVPEVAKVLAISRTAAYELVEHGALPCVRIGRSVRVRYTALIDYVTALEAMANSGNDDHAA